MTDIRILPKEGFSPEELKAVMEFAIEGMSLRDYMSNPWGLSMYARYFIYLELQKASHVYTLYEDNELVGVLMLDMLGEPKPYKTLGQRLYVLFINIIQTLFFRKSAGVYDQVNQKILARAREEHDFNGELNFFAVSSQSKGRGLGTKLLHHIEKVHGGKQLYLYTDSGSSYQFYDKRGFTCLAKETVQLTGTGKDQEMTCMLYGKTL